MPRLVKKGIVIPGYFTSDDVEGLIGVMVGSATENELREAYIRVRYGEADYTKADVKDFKMLYKEIIKGLVE